jgi:hypothetical protein
MWIMMNNAFFSIVENENNKSELLVRARVKGDIERVFKDVQSFQDENADYKYRAFVDRTKVTLKIAEQVAVINYGNFKNSIPSNDIDRHRAYIKVWGAMHEIQK